MEGGRAVLAPWGKFVGQMGYDNGELTAGREHTAEGLCSGHGFESWSAS